MTINCYNTDFLKENGYLIISSFLDKSINYLGKIENIYINNYTDDIKNKKMAPLGYQSTIADDLLINCLPYYDIDFINLATQSEIIDFLKIFLNDPYYGVIPENDANFIIAQMNARNERRPLPWHVDTRLLVPGDKPFSMQAFIALEDMDSTNGTLCIVPRSHKSMQMPKINFNSDQNEMIINLKAGDMIIFDSRLWHRTRSELNSKGAWSILLTYRCWWVKQQFDLFGLTKKFHPILTDNQKLILGGCSIPSTDIFSTSSMRRGYDYLKEENV